MPKQSGESSESSDFDESKIATSVPGGDLGADTEEDSDEDESQQATDVNESLNEGP